MARELERSISNDSEAEFAFNKHAVGVEENLPHTSQLSISMNALTLFVKLAFSLNRVHCSTKNTLWRLLLSRENRLTIPILLNAPEPSGGRLSDSESAPSDLEQKIYCSGNVYFCPTPAMLDVQCGAPPNRIVAMLTKFVNDSFCESIRSLAQSLVSRVLVRTRACALCNALAQEAKNAGKVDRNTWIWLQRPSVCLSLGALVVLLNHLSAQFSR